MKIRIEITDESGGVFEGEVTLVRVTKPGRDRPPGGPAKSVVAPASGKINFALPMRPFLKTHSKGRSGAAKFTLLVAHLAKGRVNVAIKNTDIVRAWNSATTHLGSFNPAHTTRAKDEGWVDSPKKGEYVLLPSWLGALGSEDP